MENILQELVLVAQLTENDLQQLQPLFKVATIEKGAYWMEAGRRNNNVAFVEKGYLRKFYLKDGIEITDYFYLENDFLADLPSFIDHSTPLSSVIAMEKTTLTTFSYQAFNELCKTSISLEHLHRILLERTFLRFYKRSVSFILQSPKERYYHLLETTPLLFQRAKQYHIASFLGISPQHLSRLRSES
jgi:CRP-like cAMP-binding protein